jgi:hypothetical protein
MMITVIALFLFSAENSVLKNLDIFSNVWFEFEINVYSFDRSIWDIILLNNILI